MKPILFILLWIPYSLLFVVWQTFDAFIEACQECWETLRREFRK